MKSGQAEQKNAKQALKAAYIEWGKTAHAWANAAIKQAVKIKAEGGSSEPPAKQAKVAGASPESQSVDWDESSEDEVQELTIEEQMGVEFKKVEGVEASGRALGQALP